MSMPGRKYSQANSNYRYGFNGQENDKDISEGAQDFGARIYDARLGRFFSTDPLEEEFEFISPYNFAGNNPIYFIDENGEFPKPSELLAKIGINLSPFQSGFLDGFVDGLSGWETIGFLADLTTDSEFRGQVWAGLQAMASDPMGTLKQVVADKANAYSAVFSGNASDDQEYEVGSDIGGLASGLLTGGAAVKIFTTLEKSATKKVAKEAVEAAENTTKKAAIKSTTSTNVVEKVQAKAKGGMCFVEGTLVLSINGLQPIETIKQGDTVWAYYEANKTLGKGIVSEAIVKQSKELIRLVAEQDTLLTTPDHPFYINNNWVEARNIHVGDSLQLHSGSKLAVSNVGRFDTLVTVYNLSVYGYNTYYVGTQKILVHNDGCKQQPPRRTKHVDNGHIDRTKYPDKSKYLKPNQVDKINKKTISNPTQVTNQSRNRVLYQRDMKRKIGTRGETINRTVVDTKKRKIVTSHPATTIKN